MPPRVLGALDAGAAVVCGDGFGALVALDLAKRHRALVRAAVLADPPLFMFVPEATERLAAQHAELEAAVREGGPEAGVEAWLGGRVDGPALERARAAHRAFFADYAGLASWPVTRRELRVAGRARRRADRAVVAGARRGRGRRAGRADAGRAARRRRRPRRRGAHAARVILSARRCVPGSVKARRLPVALLAALLALRCALPAGGSAAPAPTAACAAILAPRPAIELPVQVAPGLSVRVRDPYGGLIARNRLFVAFSVRYRTGPTAPASPR